MLLWGDFADHQREAKPAVLMEISDAISAAGPSCLITVSFADGILCARDGLTAGSSTGGFASGPGDG